MEKLFILDASGYIYRSYFAIQGMTNKEGESTNALFGFIRSLQKLLKDFSPQHLVAVFDGPQNAQSREALFADYKAHRKETPKDLISQISRAKEACDLMGIPQLCIPGVEADDTMGSLALWAKTSKKAEVYLCTSDKDLLQLVDDKIFVLNTFKDNLVIDPPKVKELFGVEPNQIVDYLAMIGDASDNVPGLSGFGPKTAASLLETFGSLDALLAHPEKVPGQKKQQTLVEEKEKVLLSRKLVTLDKSVPIPENSSFFSLLPPKKEELVNFYNKMQFHSLLKEFSLPTSSIEENYVCVDDLDSLNNLLKILSVQKEICFDTETTSLHPIEANLVGISFCINRPLSKLMISGIRSASGKDDEIFDESIAEVTGEEKILSDLPLPQVDRHQEFRKRSNDEGQAFYIPLNGQLGEKTVISALKPLFENEKIGFYGHNIKYDLHVLANTSIEIKNLSFDTMLASYLLRSESRQHGLDYLSLELFGKVKIPITDLIGKGVKEISMKDVPIEKVSFYACEDADYTFRLKQRLEKEIHQRGLDSLFYKIELPLIPVLMQMERHGIFLDVETLKISRDICVQKISLLEKEIFEMASEKFNLNSPKQLSEHLIRLGIKLKKTKTGYSTSADVLEALAPFHPILRAILEYRGLEKLRSTYFDSLPQEISPKTNRIHCTFNQSVAATGRLSCQNPNLQNIPIRSEMGKEIRKAFRPQKEGWIFLGADYSQIELRLLAHFSEDPTLLSAFRHNEDIHAHTASIIFNVPLEKVTKEMRHRAKAVNFGVIYGQQSFGLAGELGISEKEARSFIEKYFERYPSVKTFVENTKAESKKTGKAVTLTGRERAIPEISSSNAFLRQAAERLAINTPLQGTAADLIKQAMLKINARLAKSNLSGFLILQIHDELIFEIPESQKEAWILLVKEEMENVYSLKVPLVVDVGIGKNWKEC